MRLRVICGLLAAIVLAALAGALAPHAQAHSGFSIPSSVLTTAPPVLDGVMQPGEWGSASTFVFPGGANDGQVWVVNDGTYIYMAFRAIDLGGATSAFLPYWDDEHNGTLSDSDDVWVANSSGNGTDQFFDAAAASYAFDSSRGGTNGTTAGSTFNSVSGDIVFELRHPLCAAPLDATDVCLQVGSTYGVTFNYYRNAFPTRGYPTRSFSDQNSFGHLTIASAADTTPPAVSVISPSSAWVRGTVPFTASATDASGIDRVEFAVDSGEGFTSTGTDTGAPYESAWSSLRTGDGVTARFRAVAWDRAGNSATNIRDARVDNAAPAVSLDTPANGATVSGTIALAATASDAHSGLFNVTFARTTVPGGVPTTIGSDEAAPYDQNWDTTTVPDGQYDLTAVAQDAAGNSSISPARRVTVANSGGGGGALTTTVNSTNDADDGACTVAHCSLREAIVKSNSTPGVDTIGFSLLADLTILPTAPLPMITDPVVIDGTTQPGYAGTPIVVLRGVAAPPTAGLRIAAGGSTVKGLVINRFTGSGISLSANGGNVIKGNYIGTDSTGTVDQGNTIFGVWVEPSSPNNTIGGNGMVAGVRNVISGNDTAGIRVESAGNRVQGNYVGTNAAGTGAVPAPHGIMVFGAGNSIGGVDPGVGNVISGHTQPGVLIATAGATNNSVNGNKIGVNASGTGVLGNDVGVVIQLNAVGNTVGGSVDGVGNLIGGNRFGVIVLGSAGTAIRGNRIGIDNRGFSFSNTNDGVRVSDSTDVSVQDNAIAKNGREGVSVFGPTSSVEIRANDIHGNGGLGIDLQPPGATPNDVGDADTGPNGLQNFPELTGAVPGSEGGYDVTLSLKTAPGGYAVELFSSSSCDASGFGEGQTLLDFSSVDVGASGIGTATFFSVPMSARYLTATATSDSGQTSEFSRCFEPGAPSPESTLRIAAPGLDTLDPARSFFTQSWQVHAATCATLLAYADAAGIEGTKVRPEAATAMPVVSNAGRTYTFTLRPDFKFAPTGAAVTPASFRRAFERALDPEGGGAAFSFFRGIVGAPAFRAGTAETISGIATTATTIAFTLAAPEPEFPVKLAIPFACAQPEETPAFIASGATLPSAGPYHITSYTPVGEAGGEVVLDLNPYYPGRRPRNWQRIVYKLGASPATTLPLVESGELDAGSVPLAEIDRLRAAYGPGSPAADAGKQRFFERNSLGFWYLALNTSRPLFSNPLVRRAVNMALNRDELAAAARLQPTDQYLPPDMPGFVDGDFYRSTPTAADLAAANALIDAAGVRGQTAILLTFSASFGPAVAAKAKAALESIGLVVDLRTMDRNAQRNLMTTQGSEFDIGLDGWGADFADPFNFINTLLHGDSITESDNVNLSYFDDPYYNARMDAARLLEGEARFAGYAELEHELVRDAAPLAAFGTIQMRQLFSERIGCQVQHPVFQLSPGALCLRVPATASATLRAASPTVPAGAAAVRLLDVPLTELTLDFGADISATPLEATPLESTPLETTPLETTPLETTPLEATPLEATGLLAAGIQAALDDILLSSIPLRTAGGWESVLVGTPLAGRPLQSVTLADVFALSPLPARIDPPAGSNVAPIRLRDVDTSSSPLGNVGIVSLALGQVGIEQIGIPGPAPTALGDWCALLAGPPLNCTPATQASLQGTSVLALDLAGVPLETTPLETTLLAAVPLETTPLETTPLEATNLQLSPIRNAPLAPMLAVATIADIPLETTPLEATGGRSPLHQILIRDTASPGNIVACGGNPDLCTGSATLGDAAVANRILATARLSHVGAAALATYVLGDLRFYGAATIGQIKAYIGHYTLRDLLLAVIPFHDYPWESLELDGLPLQDFASSGSTLRYEAEFALTTAGVPPARPYATEVAVTIPDGFRYVRGSATLGIGGTSPLADPRVEGGVLVWPLSVNAGLANVIGFRLRPSLSLGLSGPAEASFSATEGGNAETAPVSVQVGDTYEPNDTPAQAGLIQRDTMIFSFVADGADVDYFRFPAPPAGSRIAVYLSHLSSDADLVLYSPATANLVPASPLRGPGPGSPLGDEPVAPEHAYDALQPELLNDVPILDRPVAGVSINRSTASEEINTMSRYAGGEYLLQVSGYNDERSDEAYMVRVQVWSPPATATCPPRPLPYAGTGVAGSLPAYPAGVNTLFLVNEKRFVDAYGAPATSALTSLRSQLGALSGLGFPSAVVPVEALPNVNGAYGTWDANPCSAEGANGVVSAIGTGLDAILDAHPTVRNVVLVGGDEVIPMGRAHDRTRIANEREFARTFSPNNPYYAAMAGETVLTDNPYGTRAPLQALDSQLYIPNLAVGRLVETPGEIAAAVQTFVSFGGRLDPATKRSLVTGYEFLSDGANAVDTGLRSLVPAAGASTLINNAWTRAQLETALLGPAPPWLASINAHFDPTRALPADQSATNATRDLFTTKNITDAGANKLLGSVLFSMGCHAGLSISDVVVGATTPDWAQTLAGQGASWAANTGYGYGDTLAVAYSEALMAGYASSLGTMSVGSALSAAKSSYIGGLGVFGVYDEKVVHEANLFGMPMYRLGPGVAPAPAPVSSVGVTEIDPVTGLPSAPFAFSAAVNSPSGFRRHTNAERGSYFDVNGRAQVTHNRPIQPLVELDVTNANTSLVAHGTIVTRLVSTDLSGFDAAFSRPTIDLGANERERAFGDAAFPSKIQTTQSVLTPNGRRDKLVLVAGQFFTDSTVDVGGVGVQRLFTKIDGRTLYASSQTFEPPMLERISGTILGASVGFSVCAVGADGENVARVYVLYRDAAQVWRGLDLVRTPATCRWTGGGPVAGDHVEFFVQAVSADGDVGTSTFKARYYEAIVLPPTPPSADITPAITGAQSGGWYTAGAQVAFTAEPGVAVEYALDGNALTRYSAPFSVTGDGLHFVEFGGSNGATGRFAFGVDKTAPQIDFDMPAEGAYVPLGSTMRVAFACTDSGSGVRTCTGSSANGSAVDTSTVGERTISVTATDAAGHTTTATRSFFITWPFGGFDKIADPPVVNRANADSTVPVEFSLGADRGLGILAAGSPASQAVNCATGAATGPLVPAASPGSNSLKYHGGRYTFLWKTDKSWPLGSCRDFVLRLGDGSERRAHFKFD